MTEKTTASEYRYIIGIDPDVDKSGFAYWIMGQKLRLEQYDLHDTFFTLMNLRENCFVRLEAGHTVKATWHKGGNEMAKRVGSNNEIGRQIEKFCKRFNVPYELVKPCGLSQINHSAFCKITGWPIKELTNPEKRVAGLLAFNKNI